LGKISYGLYVYHFPVIWFVFIARDLGFVDGAPRSLLSFAALALTVGIASLSYYLMEKPLLNLKDRFFDYSN
jgi:peptidoglycan/LPS O-acetylase OafA/YrhL